MEVKKLILRPSASHRWLACPGAAWVATAYFGPATSRSSPYASEGRTAHAILAANLSPTKTVQDFMDGEKPDKLPSEDIALIKDMAKLVMGLAELEGAEVLVETEMDAVFAGHPISGTADVILVSPDRLVLLDYKHGAGRRVRVEQNPQLTLYGLMAMSRWPNRELEIGVIQPRGVGDGLTTWIPSTEYLETFNKNVVAAIERARNHNPGFIEGPWCWGCAGEELGVCPAKLMKCLKFAVGLCQEDAEAVEGRPAFGLLEYAKVAEKVSKKLSEEAYKLLIEGHPVPGWTLQDKQGNRRWVNPDEIPELFAKLTGTNPDNWLKYPKPKVIGITEALKNPTLKGLKDENGKPLDVKSLMKRPTTQVLTPADEVPETLFDEVE